MARKTSKKSPAKNQNAAKKSSRKITKKATTKKRIPRKTSKTKLKKTTTKNDKTKNEYPIIYSYIYEREPSDINKLFSAHIKNKNIKPKSIKISGFTIVNGKIKAKINKASSKTKKVIKAKSAKKK